MTFTIQQNDDSLCVCYIFKNKDLKSDKQKKLYVCVIKFKCLLGLLWLTISYTPSQPFPQAQKNPIQVKSSKTNCRLKMKQFKPLKPNFLLLLDSKGLTLLQFRQHKIQKKKKLTRFFSASSIGSVCSCLVCSSVDNISRALRASCC